MVTVHPKDQGLATKSASAGMPVEKDFGLRILRDGTWTYQGSPIRRLALVRLFASVLQRKADGSHWLETPVERGPIEVEDVAFVAAGIEVSGDGDEQVIRLQTNLEDWVTVGPEHQLRCRRPPWQEPDEDVLVPYVMVRDGLEARVERAVYYDLIEVGTIGPADQAAGFGVWSQGAFFPLDREIEGQGLDREVAGQGGDREVAGKRDDEAGNG
jgi:hypothetical protein